MTQLHYICMCYYIGYYCLSSILWHYIITK